MNKGYFNPIRNTLLLMFLFFHQNIAYGDVCKDFNKRCPKAQKKSICFLNNFKGRVFKKNHIYCPAFSFNYLNEKKNFNLPKLTEESLKDMAKRCYVAKEITYTGFGHPDDLYSKGPKDYVPNYSGHLVGDFSFVNKYRCLFDKNLQINTPSHLAALGWFGLKGAYKSDCIEAMQAYNLSRHFFHNQRNGTVNIKKSLYTGGTRLTYNLKDRKTAFLSGGEPTEYQETNWQLKPAKMVDICKKDINRQMYDAVEENQRAQRERKTLCYF